MNSTHITSDIIQAQQSFREFISHQMDCVVVVVGLLCASEELKLVSPELYEAARKPPVAPPPWLRSPTLTPPHPSYTPAFGWPIRAEEENEDTILSHLGSFLERRGVDAEEGPTSSEAEIEAAAAAEGEKEAEDERRKKEVEAKLSERQKKKFSKG